MHGSLNFKLNNSTRISSLLATYTCIRHGEKTLSDLKLFDFKLNDRISKKL